MAIKKTNQKLDKKDHAAMNTAAKIFKGVAVVGGLIISIVPGLKGISNLVKKS